MISERVLRRETLKENHITNFNMKYKITKVQHCSTVTGYYLWIKKHWWSKWNLITNFDGYPQMFHSYQEAVDWMYN